MFRRLARLHLSPFPLVPAGQTLEVARDIFNVLHLLSSDWGLVETASDFENVNLLRATGFDAANQRPIYALSFPQFDRPNLTASRWQMQLGAKWTFSY